LAAQCKAQNVFASLNTGIMGSSPTEFMDVSLRIFCVCVVHDLWNIWYYIFLTDASVEDAGTYVCRVENIFGILQYEAHVNITGIGK
jgi:hypothetical protein